MTFMIAHTEMNQIIKARIEYEYEIQYDKDGKPIKIEGGVFERKKKYYLRPKNPPRYRDV